MFSNKNVGSEKKDAFIVYRKANRERKKKGFKI